MGSYTKSVYNVNDGGGGSDDPAIVYVNFDLYRYALDASYNDLLGYFNAHKMVFITNYYEDDGNTYAQYSYLSQLERIPNGQLVTYRAQFVIFRFYGGDMHSGVLMFSSRDPDTDLVFDD